MVALTPEDREAMRRAAEQLREVERQRKQWEEEQARRESAEGGKS